MQPIEWTHYSQCQRHILSFFACKTRRAFTSLALKPLLLRSRRDAFCNTCIHISCKHMPPNFWAHNHSQLQRAEVLKQLSATMLPRKPAPRRSPDARTLNSGCSVDSAKMSSPLVVRRSNTRRSCCPNSQCNARQLPTLNESSGGKALSI